MVLHELSHAYHHQFLDGGFENRRIAEAYEDAMKRRIYESVARARGRPQKAYAATNPQEYFAELSEAYFGINDFFPFDRTELRRHDRKGYDVVESLWGARPAPARGKATPKAVRKS